MVRIHPPPPIRSNFVFMEISRAIIEARETPAVYVLANEWRDYMYKGAARNLKERLNWTIWPDECPEQKTGDRFFLFTWNTAKHLL